MSARDDDHEWVRRVLAETGAHPEPAPDWVGQRVEETLDLLREEHRHGSAAAVVEMTPRRHRRWAVGLLAAAALAVGGYSLGATGVLGGAGGGAESVTAGDAAAGDAGSGAAGDGAAVEPTGVPALSSESLRADARLLARQQGPATNDTGEELTGLPAPVPEAAGDGLVAEGGDSARVEQDYSGKAGSGQAESQDATSSTAAEQRGPRASLDRCAAPPRSVTGTRRAVTFDSQPATAVVRPLADGQVRVQVWSCQSPQRLAQVTVRP